MVLAAQLQGQDLLRRHIIAVAILHPCDEARLGGISRALKVGRLAN